MSGSARRPLSDGESSAITALLQQGKSLLAVGTALGRSKSTVAYAATAVRAAAARARVEKRGRLKTLTDRELRTLERAIYNNGFSSMASVTEMANTTRSQAACGWDQKGHSVCLYCPWDRPIHGVPVPGCRKRNLPVCPERRQAPGVGHGAPWLDG